MTPVKVATYNVHRCIGTDGRHDPMRVGRVLQEIKADIIGLQEVDTGLFCKRLRKPVGLGNASVSCHQLAYLAEVTGYQAIEGLVMQKRSGLFGNALLTAHPVKAIRRIDLTVRGGRQRRGALDVDLEIHGRPLRVIVTHLGLALHERYFQIRRLIRALGTDRHQRILMMGDFNIFSTVFPRFRRLQRRLGPVPLVTTFPAFLPLLPLDRIWVQPRDHLVSVEAHNTPLSRMASDHLPLTARIQL